MPQARFSIGIDLGTTNSALAFAPLLGEGRPEILPIPQWDHLSTLTTAPTLPSFLYWPEAAVATQLLNRQAGGTWIVGRLARAKAGETPGRVVHSAKSWLGHHNADRSAPFLPWGSEELAREEKISPVRASALILNALRAAWEARFAEAGFAFDDQQITVTVPASFDAAAQRLTLDAAAAAGFPANTRLLEEPQAAFYCWLEHQGAHHPWWIHPGEAAADKRHVLVIDIGGGTSDFSLFELRPNAQRPTPDIHRVAVSEHILLGGDNMDLALAHLIEPRFSAEAAQTVGPQWDHLVAACRDLKERALSADASPEERVTVALPGRGSGLFAAATTATLTRAEIERLLLDGFFPACVASARPHQTKLGLRELGLPYAADSAVTRHLADFLRDRPHVDAILFNGGSLTPPRLRQLLCDQITNWQGGAAPLVLQNPEPALAVAIGAARYGAVLARQTGQITAGAGHAIFLEVQTAGTDPHVLCVLPAGATAEQDFELADPPLQLRIGQIVRFQAYTSTRHDKARAGEILTLDTDSFHQLPPLQTMVESDGRPPGTLVPIHLLARLNALNLLQISCVSADPGRAQSWQLEFNLRPHEQSGVSEPTTRVAANAGAGAIAEARARLDTLFGRPAGKTEKIAAAATFKTLERLLANPRNAWNAPLLRALWPSLEQFPDGRGLSVDHEETWLSLAGFFLRPGFGVAGDSTRMDELWPILQSGLRFPGRRIKAQTYLLWRRVAGGLSADRQTALLAAESDRLLSDKAPDELIRLTGALERIAPEMKARLIKTFIATAVAQVRQKRPSAPYLAALGLLLNRAPLYAGPETTVSPDLVQDAFAAFRLFDWTDPELMEISTLFLRATRVVGDRRLDVPASLRNQIATKLEQSAVPTARTARIRGYIPIKPADRANLFDDSLPPGLIFMTGS